MSEEKHRPSILIIAGEASGDIHGASLVREIKKKRSDLDLFGIGGDRMASAGVDTIYHVREMSFLGFFEVLKHLPFVRRVFRRMVTLLVERRPMVVILIDYPGFNLKFARAAKKHGVPVIYYISPQVWAWGRNRIKKIARLVDRMLVIFPFEAELYSDHGLDVRFVGHPLKDVVQARQNRESFIQNLNFDPGRPILGLLPGSRQQEVHRLLPEMLDALKILRKDIPDLQAVENGAVSYHHIITDLHSRSGVQHAVVLDLAVPADPYRAEVRPDHGAGPHTGVLSDLHIADYIGPFADKG